MKSDTYESDLKRVTKAFEEMVTGEETRCDTLSGGHAGHRTCGIYAGSIDDDADDKTTVSVVIDYIHEEVKYARPERVRWAFT